MLLMCESAIPERGHSMYAGRAATIAATVGWLLVAGPQAVAAGRADFVGVWLSEKRDGAMELKPCGESLCGYIHSIFSVPDPSLPMLDNRNGKPELPKR